jgi:hypothetical protein
MNFTNHGLELQVPTTWQDGFSPAHKILRTGRITKSLISLGWLILRGAARLKVRGATKLPSADSAAAALKRPGAGTFLRSPITPKSQPHTAITMMLFSS